MGWEVGIVNDGTIGPAFVLRVPLFSGGVGMPGLTPSLVMTNPDGTNVPLVLNTDFVRFELTNIVGDYELRVAMAKFALFGAFSLAVVSGHPGVGDLLDHLMVDSVFFKVNDGAATATSFIISRLNGPALSSATDFYKDGFFSPISGALRPGGPKKCTAYDGSLLKPTVQAFSAAPANGVILEYVR